MAIPHLGSKGQGWVLLQVLLLLVTVVRGAVDRCAPFRSTTELFAMRSTPS